MNRFTNTASGIALAASMLLALASYSSAKDEAPATGTASITGKVLAADGTPAAGIKIALALAPEGRAGKKVPAAADPVSPDRPKGEKTARPTPIQTATTDSDGAFQLNNLPSGEYVVIARDKEKGNGRARLIVGEGKEVKVQIKLQVRAKVEADPTEGAPAGKPKRAPRAKPNAPQTANP